VSKVTRLAQGKPLLFYMVVLEYSTLKLMGHEKEQIHVYYVRHALIKAKLQYLFMDKFAYTLYWVTQGYIPTSGLSKSQLSLTNL